MKVKILLLFLVIFYSCSKKISFIKNFDCEVETFSNLERIEDVKHIFSVYYPDHWKTNFYYDNNQSSIFSADTTKQLKETTLLDITHISNKINFDSNFLKKFKAKLSKLQLSEINTGKLSFKGKPSFYSKATGINKNFNYCVFNLFIKLNEKNYIHSKIEVYVDVFVEERICKGINLLEKTIF